RQARLPLGEGPGGVDLTPATEHNRDVSGGEGKTRSEELLKGIMLRVLVLNVLASLLGQAYSSLLRSQKLTGIVPSHDAVVVSGLVAFAVFLAIAAPWAGPFIGAEHGWKHAVGVGVMLTIFFNGGWWF